MAKKEKKDRKVVFRRIGGRIVPIAVGVGGASLAGDALRTKRVYDKGGITIDKKKNVRASFTLTGRGDKLILRKGGKKAGYSNISVDGKVGTFNFVTVKNKFRRQGLSKILTKQSAVEMKRSGAKSIINHIIHEGSLKSNFDQKRDSLFTYTRENGELYEESLSKRRAVGMIKDARKKERKRWYRQLGKSSDVFRETSLKGLKTKGKHIAKPFRTRGNKAQIVIGSAMAIGSILYGMRGNRERS